MACDVHGHGGSSFCPERYTFNAIGEDLAAFLREDLLVTGSYPEVLTAASRADRIAFLVTLRGSCSWMTWTT